MAEVRIQMECEGCGKTVIFPGKELGTVQECPECGGYLDMPELTRVPTVYDQQTDAWTRQSEETDRQLHRAAQQQEHAQKQLDKRDQLDLQEEQLLQRATQLLARWDALMTFIEQMVIEGEKRVRP